MRPRLGLHTEQEINEAETMADEAFNRAHLAYKDRDTAAMAFEMGYIKAISDLAMKEGARSLGIKTQNLLRGLDDYFASLKP